MLSRMAKRTIIERIDDLDGSVIEEGSSHTFSLDGEEWEIDLTPEHYDELREALRPYMSGGRLTSRPRVRGTSSKAKRDTEQLTKIREWARDNGYEVSAKGRIPRAVEEAYNNAENGVRTVKRAKARKVAQRANRKIS